MKSFVLFILLLAGMLVLHSCYYDKEDLLYSTKDLPCTDTTTTASYSQKVVPILQQYCYSCHSGAFPSGGITMGTHAADKAIGQNGKLYGSISYTAGYSPMPKGMSRMTSCQIATIKKWIDNNMPNN